MKTSIESLVTSWDKLYLSEETYDQSKGNLGKSLIYNNGGTGAEKFIAPHFDALRPLAEPAAFAINQIAAHNFSTNACYIFGVEASVTASATRRISMWTLNRKDGTRSWNGFITLTLATATAHTVRDFKLDVKTETTGTVAVLGTTVTGSGTLFVTNKVAIGARIGFGSTDPAQITTWYRIATRGSETSADINISAGTVAAGTPYVIQEFRFIYTATNATVTNGGIHYAKGISVEDFTPSGTTIPLAVSTDDQKAVYWIKDASTQTLTVACGTACDFENATPTVLDTFVLQSPAAGQYRIFKFNLRAPLTVASGASVSAYQLQTGTQSFSGAISQNANFCLATTQHGTGSGIKSLYCVTANTLNRIAVANVTSGNTAFLSDTIAEVPPGGIGTYAPTASLNTIEYLDNLDLFAVGTTSASGLAYITRFVASGETFDKKFGINSLYSEQTGKDTGHPVIYSNAAAVAFTNAGGNRLFVCKQGTTSALNQIYILPVGADWSYADETQGRLLSPVLTTPNCHRFVRVFLNKIDYVGSETLGKATEAVRVYARTANFSSETTGWTQIDPTGDLSGFGGAGSIQFAVEWKTIGEHCLPARVLGITLIYEDNTTDSHFAVSDKCDPVSKEFVWYFQNAFGGAVPGLRINLYNAESGGLLLTDTTAAESLGTFEKSTDNGTSWTAFNNSDRANGNTFVKYTPNAGALGNDIKVQAYLVLD